MTLSDIKALLKPGHNYICDYGQGRIETYTIDQKYVYGYDSSGSYPYKYLDDLDPDLFHSISECTTIYRKNND